MNFCIFDVITYSLTSSSLPSDQLWFDEFLYLWCDYIQPLRKRKSRGKSCDLMNFCIFDVITYSPEQKKQMTCSVVIWWIFVSLMWLHTAFEAKGINKKVLWFDEFLYLWCDYIQLRIGVRPNAIRCDLMNFCIFDVITYSDGFGNFIMHVVVIWWIFVSLMWLHTACALYTML